jgi:hypothetical protein
MQFVNMTVTFGAEIAEPSPSTLTSTPIMASSPQPKMRGHPVSMAVPTTWGGPKSARNDTLRLFSLNTRTISSRLVPTGIRPWISLLILSARASNAAPRRWHATFSRCHLSPTQPARVAMTISATRIQTLIGRLGFGMGNATVSFRFSPDINTFTTLVMYQFR